MLTQPLGVELPIIKVKITLSRNTKNEDIKAFAEVIFGDEGEDIFIIRGFTVRYKVFNNVKKLAIDFPAFPTRNGFMKSFYICNKALFEMVCSIIKEEYQNVVHEPAEFFDIKIKEEINPNDIPF